MLKRGLLKYKRRAMFYSYHTCSQEKQVKQLNKTIPMNVNQQYILQQERAYSARLAIERDQNQSEMNSSKFEEQKDFILKDISFGTNYKAEYLRYLKGETRYQSMIQQQQAALTPTAEEGKFNELLQTKQDEIIIESLKQIDKKQFLQNLLKGSSLAKLSGEILKVSQFAKGLYSNQKNDNAVNFLISLDFLVKGLMSHWQVRLQDSSNQRVKGKSTELMKGLDIKFPILIGDQYHTIAYYIVSRIGNIELTRILTVIEENFQKIFYNIENFGTSFEHNLKIIYQQFYNYLPTFFGHGFKGIALIFNLSQKNIQIAFEVGVELGYFFQFGIFSYIMCGILNKSNKQKIKDHLSKVSSILQYLSFESVEQMLYQMKTLKINKLNHEFLMLTAFHGEKFLKDLERLDVDAKIKESFHTLVNDFMKDLFEMANFDPKKEMDVNFYEKAQTASNDAKSQNYAAS